MKPFLKNTIQMLPVAILGGALTLGGYKLVESATSNQGSAPAFHQSNVPGLLTHGSSSPGLPDLTIAAELSTPAVVHIKSNFVVQARSNPFMQNPFDSFFQDDWFFGQPRQRSMESTGSGVITTPEGYIVTNNHVINGAQTVEVALNDGRTFPAEVVGADPSTDIALLKINAEELPFLSFGSSDALKVGEWVLAVGNPFNLNSTVTAGIVSAKARNIHILKDRLAIESFIQTDAAVNPGNSGGALVNSHGELVGINTAIASTTGSYSGYSFAVPVEIVKKVIQDLMDHGVVQRAFLGADMVELNGEVAKKLNLQRTQGVYLNNVQAGGSAELAGLQAGDVIVELDGKELRNAAELTEYVARKSPGDRMAAKVDRAGKVLNVMIELRNSQGTTDAVEKAENKSLDALGVDLQDLSPQELSQMNLRGGVRVANIRAGKVQQYTDIRPGFIITSLDRQAVSNAEEVAKVLSTKKGGVMLEGIYPDRPGRYYYAFGM
jgi:serine protease Do